MRVTHDIHRGLAGLVAGRKIINWCLVAAVIVFIISEVAVPIMKRHARDRGATVHEISSPGTITIVESWLPGYVPGNDFGIIDDNRCLQARLTHLYMPTQDSLRVQTELARWANYQDVRKVSSHKQPDGATEILITAE
jgi:hypothetical protein